MYMYIVYTVQCRLHVFYYEM